MQYRASMLFSECCHCCTRAWRLRRPVCFQAMFGRGSLGTFYQLARGHTVLHGCSSRPEENPIPVWTAPKIANYNVTINSLCLPCKIDLGLIEMHFNCGETKRAWDAPCKSTMDLTSPKVWQRPLASRACWSLASAVASGTAGQLTSQWPRDMRSRPARR